MTSQIDCAMSFWKGLFRQFCLTLTNKFTLTNITTLEIAVRMAFNVGNEITAFIERLKGNQTQNCFWNKTSCQAVI